MTARGVKLQEIGGGGRGTGRRRKLYDMDVAGWRWMQLLVEQSVDEAGVEQRHEIRIDSHRESHPFPPSPAQIRRGRKRSRELLRHKLDKKSYKGSGRSRCLEIVCILV